MTKGIRVKIARPGYEKFRVDNLGINIVGNPREKEYTVIQSNPVFDHDSHRGGSVKTSAKKLLVFNQLISDNPYLCFSDGKTEWCLPLQFQVTTSIASRVIRKSGVNSEYALGEIGSGGIVLKVDVDDIDSIRKDAERFGKVFHRERSIHASKRREMADSLSDVDGIHIRYLLAATMRT